MNATVKSTSHTTHTHEHADSMTYPALVLSIVESIPANAGAVFGA